MKISAGQSYTVVVKFPWGERRQAVVKELHRDADGTVRWRCPATLGVAPYLDNVLQESEQWIFGWAGGSCDVTVVVSHPDAEAPEP